MMVNSANSSPCRGYRALLVKISRKMKIIGTFSSTPRSLCSGSASFGEIWKVWKVWKIWKVSNGSWFPVPIWLYCSSCTLPNAALKSTWTAQVIGLWRTFGVIGCWLWRISFFPAPSLPSGTKSSEKLNFVKPSTNESRNDRLNFWIFHLFFGVFQKKLQLEEVCIEGRLKRVFEL